MTKLFQAKDLPFFSFQFRSNQKAPAVAGAFLSLYPVYGSEGNCYASSIQLCFMELDGFWGLAGFWVVLPSLRSGLRQSGDRFAVGFDAGLKPGSIPEAMARARGTAKR
jgi:hypothetical protein